MTKKQIFAIFISAFLPFSFVLLVIIFRLKVCPLLVSAPRQKAVYIRNIPLPVFVVFDLASQDMALRNAYSGARFLES